MGGKWFEADWFVRYTSHPSGVEAALKPGQEFATQSRARINTDEPSVDALQALLLLVLASMAAGKGKAAYSLMSKYHSIRRRYQTRP